MEVETTSEINEVIPASAPQMETVDQVAPEQAQSTDSISTATPAPAPEYKPDFSYKVYDTVKEFDPRLRSVIKSKDDEAYIRDIVTKAEGLEINKRNLEKFKKNTKELILSTRHSKKMSNR